MNEREALVARLLEIGANLAFMRAVTHGDSSETLEWAELMAKLTATTEEE